MRPPSLSLPQPPDELARLSTELGNRMVAEIQRGGPMPFDQYMRMALYEPGLGYYVNGLHKFGAEGDFVTAPGQGALFAAAVARQCDEVARAIGPGWTLMELGPGAGTLARDVLERLEVPPARYLILEPSAALRQVQRETLDTLPAALRAKVHWLDAPPEESFEGVILANEVIDALPVARFLVDKGRFFEQFVAVGDQRLQWHVAEPRPRVMSALKALAEALPAPLPGGYASEICVDLPGWLDTVTRPLARGLALFIDYGYPRAEYYHADRSDGTLVCHYRHRAHFDPFVWPGLTDISAFVDFTAAAEAGHDAGMEVAGFSSQAGFLLSLGVHEMIEQAASERERMSLAGEIKRLTLPGEMGERFKVLGLARGKVPERLAGFELMSQLHRL
ncbi:MAG TPA: SAM-dependent methyltransferase [Wenzhouxiangella sp.]|nr:SAM-dependent methyltransferase [Wenzhouxiangella sp.]